MAWMWQTLFMLVMFFLNAFKDPEERQKLLDVVDLFRFSSLQCVSEYANDQSP